MFDGSPELAREALARIEDAGRRALVEVRRVISNDIAEASGPGLAPLPGLEDLEQLVDEFGRAGVPVDLAISGRVGDVPEDVSLSSYRIVQQALTNTLSHGGSGVTAWIDVRRADDDLLSSALEIVRRRSPSPTRVAW